MVLINQYINLKIGGVTITATSTELNYNSGIVAGTASANGTLVLDASKNITGINSLTATNLYGTVQTAAQPSITSLGSLTELHVIGQTIIGDNSGGGSGVLRHINNGGDLYIQSGINNTTGSAAGLYFTNYNQTKTASARVFALKGDGKVGIQTHSPNKQLEINSATGQCLRLTYNDADGSAVNYVDLTVSSGGNLNIIPSSGTTGHEGQFIVDYTSAEALLVRKDADSGDVFVVDTTNARVGINTATPGNKLHVVDNTGDILKIESTDATGRTTLKLATNGTDWEVGARGSADSIPNAFYIYNTGYRFIIRDNSNIGINTSVPDKQLEINSATGNCLRLTYNDNNGSAANYVDFAVSSVGNLSITPSNEITDHHGRFIIDHTNSEALLVRKDADGGDILRIDTNGERLLMQGEIQCGDLVGTAGRLRITESAGTMYIQPNLDGTSGSAADLFIGDAGLTTVTSNRKFMIKANGKVGIQTNAPDKQLEINSATGDCLRLTYNDSDGSAANYVDFKVASNGKLTITPSNGATDHHGRFIVDHTNTEALLVRKDADSGDVFVVDTTNARVGINTATPGNKLHVVDNTGDILKIESTDATGRTTLKLATNGTDWEVGARGSADSIPNAFYIYDTGYRFIIRDNSNIGINTSVPDKQLEINSATGNCLRLTYNDTDGSATNYVDFAVSSVGNLSITPSNETTDHHGRFIIDHTNSEALLVRKDADGGDILRIDTNGERLLMQGEIQCGDLVSTAGRLRITESSGTIYMQPNLDGTSGSAADLFIGNAGVTTVTSSRKFMIKADGKVGIQTNAPDKQLEINSATGDCLRLTYNDTDGSATNYVDFAVSSVGNLSITPSNTTTDHHGRFIVDHTNTEALLVRKDADGGDIFTVDTTNSKVTTYGNFYINGNLYHNDKLTNTTIIQDINLTGGSYSNAKYYAVILSRSFHGSFDAYPIIEFQVGGESIGGGDLYNENSLYGIARGGGLSDHSRLCDITIIKYTNSEHRILGIYSGTQSFESGIAIYLRGGYKYSLSTNATSITLPSDSVAISSGDSTFAIKDNNGNDDTGVSANISLERDLRVNSGKYSNSDLTISGKIGINTATKNAQLHIKQSSNDSSGGIRIEENGDTNYWGCYVNTNNNFDWHNNGTGLGYLSIGGSNIAMNFTGQHRSFTENELIKFDIEKNKGLIVSINGKHKNMNNEELTINDALPMVDLSNTIKDKKVFGAISDKEDSNSDRVHQVGIFATYVEKQEGDERLFINSIGEGMVWVCDRVEKTIEKNILVRKENTDGTIIYEEHLEEFELSNEELIEGRTFSSGDLITTSDIPGYGMKQDNDIIRNYTFGKITQDCDFSSPQRYVNKNGKIITKSEYIKTGGYKCCLVGCVYYCG